MSYVLSIGEAATVTGLSVSAIRHYEQLGLIECAERVGGKRRFDPSVVNRLTFIKSAQATGFTLGEIGELLDDEVGGWRNLVDDKIRELIEQRSRLDGVIGTLTEMRECGCQAVATCEFSVGAASCC